MKPRNLRTRNRLAAGHPSGHFAVPIDEVFIIYAPTHFCLNWNEPSAALQINPEPAMLTVALAA